MLVPVAVQLIPACQVSWYRIDAVCISYSKPGSMTWSHNFNDCIRGIARTGGKRERGVEFSRNLIGLIDVIL